MAFHPPRTRKNDFLEKNSMLEVGSSTKLTKSTKFRKLYKFSGTVCRGDKHYCIT